MIYYIHISYKTFGACDKYIYICNVFGMMIS